MSEVECQKFFEADFPVAVLINLFRFCLRQRQGGKAACASRRAIDQSAFLFRRLNRWGKQGSALLFRKSLQLFSRPPRQPIGDARQPKVEKCRASAIGPNQIPCVDAP